MQISSTSKFILCLTLLTTCCASYGWVKSKSKPKPRHNYKNEYKYEKVAECTTLLCQPVHLIAVLTGSAGFLKLGQSQSLTTDGVINTYTPDKGSVSKIMWGAAVGEEFIFNSGWAVDVTTGYYQIGTVEAKGAAKQGATAYNYQYSVNSKQYLLEAKILNGTPGGLHVYGLLGVGGAFTTLGHYQTTPATVITPHFQSKTNYNFAYSAGIGFDYDVLPFARLGLGYKFVGMGRAYLGEGRIGTAISSPSLGQNALNAQEVIAQLTMLL